MPLAVHYGIVKANNSVANWPRNFSLLHKHAWAFAIITESTFIMIEFM